MQAVVVGIGAFGTLEEVLRFVECRHVHQRLGRAHLQFGIFRQPVGCLGITICSFLLLACQTVGVSEFSQGVWFFVDRLLQSRDRFVVFPRVSIERSHCAQNVRIVRSAALGAIERLLGGVRLVHFLISAGNQEISPGAGLNCIRTLEQAEGSVRIGLEC